MGATTGSILDFRVPIQTVHGMVCATLLWQTEAFQHEIKSQLTAFRQVSESGANSIMMLYRCSACDDYASWSNHRRVGHSAVHRRVSALALAT
jgi:hypothetical protein